MNRTYTITELAAEFEVTLRTIRFYEEQGMILPERVGRSRVYSARDRVRLKLIFRGKRLGLQLAEIREIIELYEYKDNEASQSLKLLGLLTDRKKQLIRQQDDIAQILNEIEQLEQHCREVIDHSLTPSPHA
mgnify:FL=1